MKNYKLKINGTEYSVDINEVEGQEIKLEVNGTPYNVTVDKELKQKPVVKRVASPRVAAAPSGTVQRSSAPTPAASAAAGAGSKISTPLPGTILDVFVNVGDKVTAGQRVALLEAMKMENNIESDVAGTVTEVKVRKGDSVLEGDVLVVVG